MLGKYNRPLLPKLKVSFLCRNQGCSHFTRGDRGSCQVQGLRVAAERCRVPIQIILRAHVLQWARCVAVRHRQSAGAFQAPVALLPLGRNCRVPTPVVRGVTQEDDGCQKTRNRQRRHTKQEENALLAAGKRPNFFQYIIKCRHFDKFRRKFWGVETECRWFRQLVCEALRIN